MRKLLSVIMFTIIVLLIGRNLTFLPRFELFTNKESATKNLQNDIASFTKQKKGVYSVYYASLDKNLSFAINERYMHTAVSVNKVPIVAVLYYLADKGKINLDEQIALQKQDIQDYGTGNLRYQKPGTLYSLKTLAKHALQESDNTAAHIINNKISSDIVQKHIQEWGLSQTDMANNKTSLADMHILFTKLYKNEIAKEALTKELLGFMKDTNFEDRLPLYLSKNTAVYHKTGDGVGISHDVGIIQTKDTVFFLGVFVSEMGDEEKQTKEVIGEIAKKVLDFEKNLK